MEETEEKPQKPNRIGDALNLLENLKQKLSYKDLEAGKFLMIVLLIVDAVVFGWLWKNKVILMALFISGMLLLIGMFAMQRYFFPDGDPDKEEFGTKKKKKDMKDDLKFDMDLGKMIPGIPTPEQYSKELFGGTKKDPYGLDKIYKV
jgi:hypothetical protein